ncbi:MAG: hypothetical protein HYS27_09655 [Deltaproteobacteria bacterium]|nr:hypothetical protein [Deltaproteobacteria bacterium]
MKHVAIAGEVLLGFAAVAAYVGILDVRSVADVTPGEWFEVVLLALPVVAALVMVSLGLAWWLKKKDITKPTGVHAVALLGVLMVLVGCLTALRLVAATPSEELGGAASAIGALALTILSAAGSVATAVAVAVASLLGEPLQKALDDHMALVRNLDEDVEEARKGQAKPHARAKELRDAAERPSRWMLAFASSVKACAMRMRDDEEQVKLIGEAAEALSARILELSKPSREDLVATLEEYEVVSRDDVRRSNGAGKGIVAGLAIMAASQLTACSPSPPTNAIFVCDATGKPPACTPAVRRAFGERWARTAFDRPGSSIRVVITADSFEATRSVVVATSPPHGKGDRRVARERFARETGEAAENLDVPGDGEGKVNRSNLPAALAAATLLAREMDAPPALMVATDGMVVVERDNGERDPTAYERLAGHLDDMGIEIDMGRFASVTACGFRREGLPPRLVAARDRFWATLLGHLPSDPVPPSSCTGLFGATKRGARGTP